MANVGDLAMLMMTVRRLREQMPSAHLFVSSFDPLKMRDLCPGVDALDEVALSLLFWRRIIPGSVSRFLPFLQRHEDRATLRQPLRVLRMRAWRNSLRGERPPDTARCIEALQTADLFVAAGGGYLNDLFPGHANRVLSVLQVGLARRRPLALLGQGLGPMEDPHRIEALTRICRAANIVRLREGIVSPQVARRCGADAPRVQVTGDDAIELAWERRPAALGNAIGVNVRLHRYSGIEIGILKPLREVLEGFAAERGTTLITCPISFDDEGGDVDSVRNLLAGSDLLETVVPDKHPVSVIQQAGRCRVVVTGSYHAGVFALSQGIPVIGLARSAYYVEKFSGLAAQFNNACVPVRLDLPDFPETFRRQLTEHWEKAEAQRNSTLQAAEKQIQLSRAAYAEIPQLLKMGE